MEIIEAIVAVLVVLMALGVLIHVVYTNAYDQGFAKGRNSWEFQHELYNGGGRFAQETKKPVVINATLRLTERELSGGPQSLDAAKELTTRALMDEFRRSGAIVQKLTNTPDGVRLDMWAQVIVPEQEDESNG